MTNTNINFKKNNMTGSLEVNVVDIDNEEFEFYSLYIIP
jgi:hypothetical protein